MNAGPAGRPRRLGHHATESRLELVEKIVGGVLNRVKHLVEDALNLVHD